MKVKFKVGDVVQLNSFGKMFINQGIPREPGIIIDPKEYGLKDRMMDAFGWVAWDIPVTYSARRVLKDGRIGVHIHQHYLERAVLNYRADQVADAEEDLL